jgi:hypothetical protein
VEAEPEIAATKEAWKSRDFGYCVYPSRNFPYFASGRLIAGCLVPFALLYVYGLRQFVPRRVPGLLLALLDEASSRYSSKAVLHQPLERRASADRIGHCKTQTFALLA